MTCDWAVKDEYEFPGGRKRDLRMNKRKNKSTELSSRCWELWKRLEYRTRSQGTQVAAQAELLFIRSVVSNASAIPRTIARQGPLSMGFPRQEHWSRLPCPPPISKCFYPLCLCLCCFSFLEHPLALKLLAAPLSVLMTP